MAFGMFAINGQFAYYTAASIAATVTIGVLTFVAAGQLFPQLFAGIGALERISVYGYMVWVIVLASVLLKVSRVFRQPEREQTAKP